MLDYTVIAAYIVLINLIGFRSSRVKTMADYFQGRGSMHWLALCFSIVATETSSLTFISIPGLAYISDLGFLQVAMGYMLGRVLVAAVLIPRYFRGNIETTYHFLQQRFGAGARRFMAVIFLVTRLLADGIRLFATAIPLAMLMGLDGNYLPAILIIGGATFLYTLYGGIRSVVVVDVVQLVLYLFCAVLGIFLVADIMHTDIFSLAGMIPDGSTRIFHSGMGPGESIFSGYNVVSGLIGGAFLSFASHGTDHLMVQRVLSCRNESDAKKAMVASGVVVFIQFMLFMGLGLFISVLLEGRAFDRPDEIMPFFILNHLPAGIKGLMLAGIFAAAMSTIASSINSLSSSTVMDILDIPARGYSERKNVLISRATALCWTAVMIALASMLKDTSSPLVELGLSIASITYGGMLGIFLQGALFRKFSDRAALAGVILSIAAIIALTLCCEIFWPWYVPIGFCVSFISGVVIDGVMNRLKKA